MTLCMAWKSAGIIRFASDSRLMFNNSHADVGIKVLSLPYRILSPTTEQSKGGREVAFSGELGMCFAGSTLNSLIVKESMVEILKSLQYAPGTTDISMDGIAKFIFTAYKIISRRVCETNLSDGGRADIIICGRCPETNRARAFLLSTDKQNNHSMNEILTDDNSHYFIGAGKDQAETDLPQYASDHEYLNVLKSVIDNHSIESVGGNIQYGEIRGSEFVVLCVIEFGKNVHYWRGALDMNSNDFMVDHTSIIPGIVCLDPFGTIGV